MVDANYIPELGSPPPPPKILGAKRGVDSVKMWIYTWPVMVGFA